MFSALDNALSQKAEDTLTEFAAVKKADVQLQTTLGNRKGQIAANVIGAFVESQSSAFGWQVRAFGAEDGGKGANVGVFYRNITDYTKIGMNSFVDYEDGDYGEFYRASIGGEISTSEYSFAANYYLPITDDKRGGGKVAFSQKGYDANLRIAIPRLDFLKVAADYYHFDGEYGVEDDKGLRYGLEVQPINDLRIGVFYDDGGEKFGGDIVYAYNFGNRQKRESTADFSPDLFSPIVREYSQRILITTTERIEVLRTPTFTTFITTTIPPMTTRNIIANFITLINSITMATATITNAMTMAGMTTTMAMTIMTMTATRRASVLFNFRTDFRNILQGRDEFLVFSTRVDFLLTLPTLDTQEPYVLTLMNRDLLAELSGTQPLLIVDASSPGNIGLRAGHLGGQTPATGPFTITIVEGSEKFISVAVMLSITTKMTAADIITETEMTLSAAMTTRMTNAATPTTMEIITAATTTISISITFATSTITIGAAKVDSHLPPSFPPLSFPPFPQLPNLALAENLRPQLSFPRRRESTRRRAANIAAAKPPVIRRGFYIPVIPA